MITANGLHAYEAKGIPEQLLPIVRATLGMNIQSSPPNNGAGDWRVPAATKMWERLVERNIAEMAPIDGVFRLIE